MWYYYNNQSEIFITENFGGKRVVVVFTFRSRSEEHQIHIPGPHVVYWILFTPSLTNRSVILKHYCKPLVTKDSVTQTKQLYLYHWIFPIEPLHTLSQSFMHVRLRSNLLVYIKKTQFYKVYKNSEYVLFIYTSFYLPTYYTFVICVERRFSVLPK